MQFKQWAAFTGLSKETNPQCPFLETHDLERKIILKKALKLLLEFEITLFGKKKKIGASIDVDRVFLWGLEISRLCDFSSHSIST